MLPTDRTTATRPLRLRLPAMGLWAGMAVALGIAGGCQPTAIPVERVAPDATMFGPVEARIFSFTAVADWNGDGQPDGVDAMIELKDRFENTTMATGTVLFELWEYQRGRPDPRGQRVAAWRASLQTADEQREHWNRISQTYSFQLACPDLRFGKQYVLESWFEHASRRLNARVILGEDWRENRGAARKPKPATGPATQPASQPGGGPAGVPPKPPGSPGPAGESGRTGDGAVHAPGTRTPAP